MKYSAVAHGAASIINAIATGKGAAFGISLSTKAEVEITDNPDIDVVIEEEPEADPVLVRTCVKNVFRKLGLAETFSKSLD
jgi:shikimate kinase